MEDHEYGKGRTETLILSKKDEQERVQKKTFTNWINTYLVQAHPPYKIDNLFESIKDGLCLIHLLEVMTGEKLRKEQPKHMQKIHRLSNINSALDFLKNRKIKLVNINATDIEDGRPSIILGLMWTVILFFQIEEQEEILIGALGPDFDGKVNAKAALLNWVNKTIGDKYDLNVKDFGPSWRDGKAFNALVHNIDSSLVNWDDVKKRSNNENLLEAFKQAEELGIPHIIDAQDVDVEKPDEKSIMTYITQFLKSYPEGGKGIEEQIVPSNKRQEEAAQKALEEEERLRQEEEEKRLRQEEEDKRRKEEELRRKNEEEKRKQKELEEIERRKREEEKKRKEEEERLKREEAERKKREEEERKRREEEERKRREEEKRRKEEEEQKKRDEIERKRKEEEERRRKEEEERRKREEEKKRKEEEERKRKEEEERRRKEEEERKRKEEAERKRKEEEERKRKEEEEKRRKEEEERKRKLAAEEDKRKAFKKQIDSMGKWIDDLNQFLEDGVECDNESICSFLENLNGLLSDKELIDEDLNALKDDVKAGKCGIEYIKPLLNDIQEFEKQLKESLSRANSVKNALTQNCEQIKSFDKNINDISDWLNKLDQSLEQINTVQSPEQCEQLINEFQNKLYTEPEAQNCLKEGRDIYSKLKNSAPKNLKDEKLIKKMREIETRLKERTGEGKAIDKSIKDFNKTLSKANDWQKDYEKKVNNLGPLSNDMAKLKQQLDKIENLKKLQGDGDKVVQEAIEKGQSALSLTNMLEPVQKKINLDLESVENKWLQNIDSLDNLRDEILEKLSQVEGVMQSGNKVESWLKEKECDLKASKGPCDTLSQKTERIDYLKKLLNDVEDESPILEDYFRQLEEIARSDPNALRKLNSTKQQLNNLKQNLKNSILDAESRVNNHEDFVNKLDAAGEWIEMAKQLKLDAMNKDMPGNMDELKRRKEILDKLIESKNNGEKLVKEAVLSGELVARESSLKGKEEILNGVRGLNKDFLDLFDGLGAAKQAIEMKLSKANNINRDLDGLVNWAEEFERKLDNITDSDIDKIKILCDEAQGKLYTADSLYNQSKLIDDPELLIHAEQIKVLVKDNLENAQQMYSHIKENINSLNDLMKNCKQVENWLMDSEKKMMRFGDSPGSTPEDLNNNLRSLQKLTEDIKAKRNDIEKLQSKGRELSVSSPSKADEIDSAMEKIEIKYQQLLDNLENKDQELRDNIKDQKEFDEAMHKAQQWLNDATQKLLKYSDIKQCTPALMDTFYHNFETIVDSIPYGEETINSTIDIGQSHLSHIKISKPQGANNLERDSKRVNELDKNWKDFKKQVDLINKNVHRVQDNLNDFNLLQQKLESYLKDKENCLNECLPADSFKYIIREIDDAAKDLDKLQTKANEVCGSLNFPNAPLIAKGIVDRYQNLKRNIETELNKSKQLENDWAAYKNALSACEKWIVDTGFRIIENDYSAFSPEDAQTKLEDYSKNFDQIENFSQDINRIIKIGNQLSQKISENQKSKTNSPSFNSHSESEIETDLENLTSSHKNLLQNAKENKNRLSEQLVNWRKYRDLVQVNDNYLSNDLADWWKNKKKSPPQNNDDVNKNIKEAEEILNNLLARQSEMKMSKSNCQSLTLDNSPRNFSAIAETDRRRKISQSNPLSRLAMSVETGLEKNIQEIQKYIPQMDSLLQDWKSFDKDAEELENWAKEKEILFEKHIEQPCLKTSSLTDDQRQFGEQLKKDIDNHERAINALLEKAQSIGSRKINPILKRVEDLKRKLKRYLDRKDEEIDAVDFASVKKQAVACQNSGTQFNESETIATQTLPEKCSISTSTEPRIRKLKPSPQKHIYDYVVPVTKQNIFGMRNSGGNRGLSKMLYPYCCTSDLLNQKMHLDYAHGTYLRDQPKQKTPNISSHISNGDYRPNRLGMSKLRNSSEESIRKNWMTQDLI